MNNNKIRVIAVWNDYLADYIFFLEEYIPPKRFFLWMRKGYWKRKIDSIDGRAAHFSIAEKWCKHYGVDIEYPK